MRESVCDRACVCACACAKGSPNRNQEAAAADLNAPNGVAVVGPHRGRVSHDALVKN